MVTLGSNRHLVTLDEPNGSAGYLPLDPATWYCGIFDEGLGGIIRFEGPFHPGISTQTRVHVNGRVFHVDHVNNREARDVALVLTTHEVFE